jgi:hypothetical protein
MKATQKLHALGQSIWLDNITRELLTSGTLQRYINELSVTGLTSNPTIFDHANRVGYRYSVGPTLSYKFVAVWRVRLTQMYGRILRLTLFLLGLYFTAWKYARINAEL